MRDANPRSPYLRPGVTGVMACLRVSDKVPVLKERLTKYVKLNSYIQINCTIFDVKLD